MPIRSRLIISLIACMVIGHAAEPAVRPSGPGRMQMSFEVEVLTVKPDDVAGVTAWATLAGQGYHVVGTAAKADGSTVLYLERLATPGDPQVPALVRSNPAAAEALRAALLERQQANRPAPAGPMTVPAK